MSNLVFNCVCQNKPENFRSLLVEGINKNIVKEGLKSKTVMQVHDEIILSVPVKEVEVLKSLVSDQIVGILSK